MAARIEQREMIAERLAPVLVAKTLTSFDLVVIFIGIVLFIVNAAGFQFVGPAAFVYLILAYLTFLIPGCFVTAQLGRMFPEEGSIYVWTHKALGPFWGFFAGFVAWWPGPLAMVFAPILVVSLAQGIWPDALTETWQQGVLILAVLWFSALLSVLRQRVSQNYVNFQFVFYAAALFVMSIAGFIWLWKGNPAANSFAAENWNPFIYANVTVFGFAFLALLGIEVPLNMGVEVKSEKSIRDYLLWGSIIVMVAYLGVTFSTMVVIPLDQVNGVNDAIPTVGTAIAGWLGDVVGLILIWFFVSNTAIYNYSFARLIFVSGLEKRLPHQVGRVNKNGVPANAVLFQTIAATIPVVLIWFVFGAGGDIDPNTPYFALLASANVILGTSMLILFADVFFVKKFFPERYEQARRIPDGALMLSGVVGFLASAVAIWTTFVAPWYPPGFTTGEWRVWLAVITGLSAGLGLLIYAISQSTRRGKTDEDLIAEAAAAMTGPGG
jgi:glutamate:GABA antiporter